MNSKHIEEATLSAIALLGVAGFYMFIELFYIWAQR